MSIKGHKKKRVILQSAKGLYISMVKCENSLELSQIFLGFFVFNVKKSFSTHWFCHFSRVPEGISDKHHGMPVIDSCI